MWKYDWYCLLQMQLMIQRNWIASINGLAVDSTLQSASKEERERKPCLSIGGDTGLIPKILLGYWSNLWTWCLKFLNHCCWPTAQSDSAPSPSMFKLKQTTTTGWHQNAAEGRPEPGSRNSATFVMLSPLINQFSGFIFTAIEQSFTTSANFNWTTL